MTPLTLPDPPPLMPRDLPVRVHLDAERDLFWVPMSVALLPDLLTDWSDPVQAKVVDGQLTFRRPESREMASTQARASRR